MATIPAKTTKPSILTAVFIPLLLLVGTILLISQPAQAPVLPVTPMSVTPAVTPAVKPVEKPELIVFEARWCSACQSIKQQVNDIEASGIKVTRIDADQHPELLAQFGVESLPTMFVKLNNKYLRTQDIEEALRWLNAAKER